MLAFHPELGDSGCPLELTADADLLLEPVNEAMAETLQVALGRDSAFMAETGFCADILRPEIEATLPAGWQSRLRPLSDYDNVFALDPYDLAMVKLVLGRAKDLDLLRALMRSRALNAEQLQERYRQTPLGEREMFSAGRNLRLLLKEAGTE